MSALLGTSDAEDLEALVKPHPEIKRSNLEQPTHSKYYDSPYLQPLPYCLHNSHKTLACKLGKSNPRTEHPCRVQVWPSLALVESHWGHNLRVN